MFRQFCGFVTILAAIAYPLVAQTVVDEQLKGVSATQPPVAYSDEGFEQRNPRYVLRNGDSFEVAFRFSPEFNETVTIEPDGYITLQQIGSLHVIGQTLPELTETIKKAYTGILNDPTVTITLKEFEKPYFIAAGQVAKPGKYELRTDLSLVEAVNVAGGFLETSKHSQVVLFRRVSNDRVETHVFDVKKMLVSKNLEEDPQLLPGDMVYVPQNVISKIRKYLPTSSLGLYASPLTP
jgi:polysaccharide export outer membrane protein